MRMYWGALIALIIISFLIDLYFYKQFQSALKKKYIRILYWLPVTAFSLFFLFIRFSANSSHQVTAQEFYITSWILWVYYLLYFPRIFFTLFDLIHKLIALISRKRILFFRYLAITVCVSTALLLIYGTIVTRTDFKLKRISYSNEKLPKSFKGFKIVQISDIHLGGWGNNYKAIDTVVAKIMREKPDMIVMTGDMVNNFATELQGWKSHFRELKAPYGVYAILGNHDYGDYSQWPNAASKKQNLDLIKSGIRDLGFNLLLDTAIIIHKENDSLALIGVQNWGRPPFPRYGDLHKAMKNITSTSYKILLSHDPTHWEAEVVQKTDIALTLAGHTHGMQLGYDDGEHKFSPSQWIFKQWNGLYTEGTQSIYVNQGIGYVGAPFRIGIKPEITLITLQ